MNRHKFNRDDFGIDSSFTRSHAPRGNAAPARCAKTLQAQRAETRLPRGAWEQEKCPFGRNLAISLVGAGSYGDSCPNRLVPETYFCTILKSELRTQSQLQGLARMHGNACRYDWSGGCYTIVLCVGDVIVLAIEQIEHIHLHGKILR